jgi:hypothetical protein
MVEYLPRFRLLKIYVDTDDGETIPDGYEPEEIYLKGNE